MFVADPRLHLRRGVQDRRCWECSAWIEWDRRADTAQPLGDCARVRWMLNGARQMTHADDVCAKFEQAAGRSLEERENRAVEAGLG
ncbi:MAG TPA: hypothetical protein VFL92_09470 [Sphingomonas sp.]|nr:hypothetical protein [Sphingomonas sp.]